MKRSRATEIQHDAPAAAAGRTAATAQDGGASTAGAPHPAGVVALHRSRLFDWKPSAVAAISVCPGAPLFAVGYENGSLELWDVHQLVCTQVRSAGAIGACNCLHNARGNTPHVCM